MQTNRQTSGGGNTAPSDDEFPPRWQRLGLNVLFLLILATIGWCNLPDAVPQRLHGAIARHCDSDTAYRLRFAAWVWRWGAHVAGFDNKWQMYGLQSRFNWHYEIIATYGSGDGQVDRLLPLPRQMARSRLQTWVVDFKEAKFHLNIYSDPLARETYAHYLARQYPTYQGQGLKRIRYDLKYQYILPPLVAVKEQQLLEDWVETDTVSDFDLAHIAAETILQHDPTLHHADARTR